MAFTIKVNGTARRADVDADTPLLWVLRDVLGMSGTKFGCGVALCGACTVHVDGVPARSCVTPIGSIGNKAVTDRGGGKTPHGKALQQAWLDLEVVQCGYCSPARSCRPRRCSPPRRSRAMPTSMPRCPATSAAAAPISASAPQSTAPRPEGSTNA